MLSITEISQLFDDITKAASKKAKPIIYDVVLMNAGRQTELSMSIALALQIPAQERASVTDYA
jgi:hypothetical protein